jgi:CheY-like chemotaxis protein
MESKVLVVDDEKENREFLNRALRRLGGYPTELAESEAPPIIRIGTATSPEEALSKSELLR